MLTTESPVKEDIRRSSHPVPATGGDAGLLAVAMQHEQVSMTAVAGAPAVAGYQIISRLGTGSSGEVWLAEELETGRILALKVFHCHGAAGASAEVMQREIRMLAKLVHPNLVLLHKTIVTSDGRQGLATEWIDGWPLDEWLRRHPNLTLTEKLALFRGIVEGVAFLHDHGVIHRDLKPANLIVNAEGRAKIVDFGLARFHQESSSTGHDGGSIGVSGTLHFMAPEQAANGDGARAMPVDVYALGLILHRLLTGNWLLAPGGTPAETLAMVVNPPPLVLNGPARTLPRDLQSILRQSLAPDPARRYRHARDLEADLERFDAKLPVAARKHTVVYLITTLLRRQARHSIIAAGLVSAGLATGGVMYHRHRRITERNEANLRHAYSLTSFALNQLRDELRIAVPEEKMAPKAKDKTFPVVADGEVPMLPVNAAGELDLRYYHAQLADLQSATSEGQSNYASALSSIQNALDLYSLLAHEAPDDPKRLLDAVQARLSFARLLDRTGQMEAAGSEAYKSLSLLDRLASWPGFDQTLLPPLRCDALRLAAKDAHRDGDSARAIRLSREMLSTAESLPSGLLVRLEGETAPRLALAASDLAVYAINSGPACWPDARNLIDRAISSCRAAHERNPKSPALTRGLAYCLHAKARLSLHAGPGDDLRDIIVEGTELLIGDGSRVRLSSFPLIRDFSATATAWTGAMMNNPNTEIPEAAMNLALRLVSYLRNNGEATEEVILQRGQLYIYESRLACRNQDPDKGARAATRAVRMLGSHHEREPGRLGTSLLTAAALHQSRTLAGHSNSIWEEKNHGPILERLLKQLSERSNELTPEQQRELSLLR